MFLQHTQGSFLIMNKIPVSCKGFPAGTTCWPTTSIGLLDEGISVRLGFQMNNLLHFFKIEFNAGGEVAVFRGIEERGGR